MSFSTLCRRVERTERLVEQRSKQTCLHWQELQYTWRASWTPRRIVIVGLGLGFIAGHKKPRSTLKTLTGKLSGTQHLIHMLGAISTFFATTCADNDAKLGKTKTGENAASVHASTSGPEEAATNLSKNA
ncbi:MAG TPA: hypothetical protein ACQGQH_06715 [Xylella sp.]